MLEVVKLCMGGEAMCTAYAAPMCCHGSGYGARVMWEACNRRKLIKHIAIDVD